MADLTINIPAPTLTPGQYFKERHRLLPFGSWSGYFNRSNAPFTLTGLSEGEYEFEFVLVNADATECTATYRTYTIVDDYECISFNSEMKKVNGLYHIEVTYTLPGGHTDPSCGWEIEWSQNGNTNVVPYATLPASGIIKIPCTNDVAVLYVRAKMCNGKTKNCHVADITNFPDPPCQPFSNVTVQIIGQWNGSSCDHYVVINFTQSSPATTSALLDYKQWHHGAISGDFFNGNIPISATATSVKVKLTPLWYPSDEYTDYYVTFVDVCGNGWPYKVRAWRYDC